MVTVAVTSWNDHRYLDTVCAPGKPPLREQDVMNLSSLFSWAVGTGCSVRLVSLHRRDLTRSWKDKDERAALQGLIEQMPDPGHEASRGELDSLRKGALEARVGMLRRRLTSQKWADHLAELHEQALPPSPTLTLLTAEMVVEAFTMVGRYSPGCQQLEIPVENPPAIKFLGDQWKQLNEADRWAVSAVEVWWRGYAPLDRDWLDQAWRTSPRSPLFGAFVSRFVPEYRHPPDPPKPMAARPSPRPGGGGGAGPMPPPLRPPPLSPPTPTRRPSWEPPNAPVKSPFPL